jgi:hypothetical protein
LETKSINRLLSLLELGGQTALVRIHPSGTLSSNGASPGAAGQPQAGSWYAELYIQMGQLQYSAVFNAAGERRLVGNQAINFLGQMGGLAYELLPLPAQPGFPPPGSATGPLPPYPSNTGSYGPPRPPNVHPAEAYWSPGRSPSPTDSWRPARTTWGETVAYNPHQLTRDQRRVLALINGQRSVDELSRLLGFSSEALYEVLAYFREQNLIS